MPPEGEAFEQEIAHDWYLFVLRHSLKTPIPLFPLHSIRRLPFCFQSALNTAKLIEKVDIMVLVGWMFRITMVAPPSSSLTLTAVTSTQPEFVEAPGQMR